MQYAKFIVAIVGAGVTAALGIIPAGSNTFTVLTILAAVVTAAGVYLVPNAGPVESEPVQAEPDSAPTDPTGDDYIPRHSA